MDYPNEYFPSIQKDLHGGIILGQIGYYCDNKNQLFTLEILNDLVRNGKNARIYFIGYPSSEEPQYIGRMREYIHKNNLESHIKFLPSNFSKEQFFKKIDMLLLPSIHEGLSLTLMEAQFSNIFCLASSGVPKDVNFGLCKFIELRKEFWIDAIESFNDLGQLKPIRIYKKEEFEETLMSVIHQIFIEDYGE